MLNVAESRLEAIQEKWPRIRLERMQEKQQGTRQEGMLEKYQGIGKSIKKVARNMVVKYARNKAMN